MRDIPDGMRLQATPETISERAAAISEGFCPDCKGRLVPLREDFTYAGFEVKAAGHCARHYQSYFVHENGLAVVTDEYLANL